MSIIVRIYGLGVGNLMFQYAASKALSKSLDIPFKLDFNSTRGSAQIEKTAIATKEQLQGVSNWFSWDFNIASTADLYDIIGPAQKLRHIPKIGERFLKHAGFLFNVFTPKKIYEFDRKFDKINSSIYLNSTYINPKYFKEIASELQQEFELKTPIPKNLQKFFEAVKTENSVSIHIRRGDYMQTSKTNNLYPIYGLDYIQKAVDIIASKTDNISLYAFSDDPAWFSELDHGFDNLTVISGDNPPEVEMELMKQCKHNIICNSTFSWWPAFLNSNPDKIVISPKIWRNDEINTDDMNLPDWITI